MRWLNLRTCLIYVMLIVVVVNSLGCSNSLRTNSHNSTAKDTHRNELARNQKHAEAKTFEETCEDVAEAGIVIIGVTATVAWEMLKTVAECPCFWHCVIHH
jgi:hypothetical protein